MEMFEAKFVRKNGCNSLCVEIHTAIKKVKKRDHNKLYY